MRTHFRSGQRFVFGEQEIDEVAVTDITVKDLSEVDCSTNCSRQKFVPCTFTSDFQNCTCSDGRGAFAVYAWGLPPFGWWLWSDTWTTAVIGYYNGQLGYWKTINYTGSQSMWHYKYNADGFSKQFNIKDYDDINGDETFILIYSVWNHPPKKEYDLYVKTADDYYTNPYSYAAYTPSIQKFWVAHELLYNIAYRLRGKSVIKEEICKASFGDLDTESSPGYLCPPTIVQFAKNQEHMPFQGQAMFNPSTKIFTYNGKTYIAYSYSIYDYIGDPNSDDLWVLLFSELSSDWRFNKRIVGLIDADTGQKSEIEITDTFLGDIYKGKFDKTLYGAIGFHNGSVNK